MCVRVFVAETLLRYVVTWNTNSRNCHVAQHVLALLLRHFTFEELKTFADFKTHLEALLPYTDRHVKVHLFEIRSFSDDVSCKRDVFRRFSACKD